MTTVRTVTTQSDAQKKTLSRGVHSRRALTQDPVSEVLRKHPVPPNTEREPRIKSYSSLETVYCSVKVYIKIGLHLKPRRSEGLTGIRLDTPMTRVHWRKFMFHWQGIRLRSFHTSRVRHFGVYYTTKLCEL